MAKKNNPSANKASESLDPLMQEAFAKAEAFINEIEERNEGEPRASDALRRNLDVTLSFRVGALDRRLLTELAHLEGKKASDLAREIMLEGLAMRQIRHDLLTSSTSAAAEGAPSADQLLATLAQLSGPIQAVAALSNSTLGLLSGLQNAAIKQLSSSSGALQPKPVK